MSLMALYASSTPTSVEACFASTITVTQIETPSRIVPFAGGVPIRQRGETGGRWRVKSAPTPAIWRGRRPVRHRDIGGTNPDRADPGGPGRGMPASFEGLLSLHGVRNRHECRYLTGTCFNRDRRRGHGTEACGPRETGRAKRTAQGRTMLDTDDRAQRQTCGNDQVFSFATGVLDSAAPGVPV